MRRFGCPDESHLDCRDASQFTRVLIEELLRRGALL
jgi:hypothetical protein